MIRCLLINPFYPISETPSPPLGLAFLAGALARASITVDLADFVVYPYNRDRLRQYLSDFNPHVVGVTAVTMTVDEALKIVADVKSLMPSAITVMGGPHVSFCAAQTLAHALALDIVVKGEGEQSLVDLCRAVDSNGSLKPIAGIAFRNGQGIVETEPRELADVNALAPPARHLLPLGRYRALGMPISMTSSRGCPFHCIFCVGRKMVGAKVRYRDPHQVVDELAELAQYGFHQINLADDLFTANRKRCHAVCDEIMRRGLVISWTAFARVDTVDEDLLRHMRAAGCHAVSFGIETADPDILKTIRKGITLAQATEAVRMCRRAGMTAFASFILGLPGETAETVQRTIDFARNLEADGLAYGFHLLAPFPGTRVRDHLQDYGLTLLTNDWRDYHANRAIVVTPDVNADMLNSVVKNWEDAYNQELARIGRRMKSGKADAAEAEPLVNLERIVLSYDLMMAESVETHGHWPADAQDRDPADSLQKLAERLQPYAGKPLDMVHSALQWQRRHDNLIQDRAHGCIQWRWRDYL